MPIAWPPLSGELVLMVVEAAAVLVSAIAGMIVASNKKMDVVGAFALACLNAFGGGTIRDVLLDNRPFYWMQRWELLIAILALFTIAGVGIARAQGSPLVVAAMMGVITGTAGGVLRDVVVNEIPDLFRPGGLYATASLAGALAFIGALENGLRYSYAVGIGVVVIVGLRLVSVRHGLTVPAPQWHHDEEPRTHGD